MKKFASSLLFAAALLFAVPAIAADIDINLGVGAGGIVQTGIASALSDLDSTADVSQIAGLGSVTGNYTDDVNVLVGSGFLAQIASATAVVPPGSPAAAASEATVLQVAGLANLDLDNVVDGALINVGVLSIAETQTGVSSAIGVASASASVSQLTGVGVISINVAD